MLFCLPALLLFIPEVAAAQLRITDRPHSELYVRAGGGMSGVNYSVAGGESTISWGLQGGVGFTYMLHANWGVGIGLELASYNTTATLRDGLTMAIPLIYDSGDPFEWRISTVGYEETQTAYLFNVPIVVHYQRPVANAISLYVDAGIKIGMSAGATYEASAASISTGGYFPVTDELITGGPGSGFGTLVDWQHEGSLGLSAMYAAVAEVGAKFRVAANMSLYAGLYIDYGLNNISGESKISMISYLPVDLQDNKTGHSMLRSTTLVDRVSTLAFGINLRLAFEVGFGSSRSSAKSKTRYYQCTCP